MFQVETEDGGGADIGWGDREGRRSGREGRKEK